MTRRRTGVAPRAGSSARDRPQALVAAGRYVAGQFDWAVAAGAGDESAAAGRDAVAPLGAVAPLWPDGYERKVLSAAAHVGRQHKPLARGVLFPVQQCGDRASRPRRVRNSSMTGYPRMASVIFKVKKSCRPRYRSQPVQRSRQPGRVLQRVHHQRSRHACRHDHEALPDLQRHRQLHDAA